MNRPTPTERELGLMGDLINQAHDLSQEPTNVQLRQRLDWAHRDLEAFGPASIPHFVRQVLSDARLSQGGTE